MPSIYFELTACPSPANDAPFEPAEAPWFAYLPPEMQAECRDDFESWGNDRETFDGLAGSVESSFDGWFKMWRGVGAVQALRQLLPEIESVVMSWKGTDKEALLDSPSPFDEIWPELVASSRSA